jgi:hypothetical protein
LPAPEIDPSGSNFTPKRPDFWDGKPVVIFSHLRSEAVKKGERGLRLEGHAAARLWVVEKQSLGGRNAGKDRRGGESWEELWLVIWP